MAGKGSKPRPFSVDQQTFDDNWDKIFSQTTAAYHQGTSEKQPEEKNEKSEKNDK